MPAIRISIDPFQRVHFARDGVATPEWEPRSDGTHELTFCQWLEAHPEARIQLAVYQEPFEISAGPPIRVEAGMSCDLVDRKVQARISYFDSVSRERYESVRPLGRSLLFLPTHARIGVLENPELVRSWKKLEKSMHSNGAPIMEIPFQTWNEQLFVPGNSLSLRWEHSPAAFEKAKPKARLQLRRLPDGKRVAIHPVATTEGIEIPTLVSALETLLTFRSKAPERLFHSHERSVALYRALGQALLAETPDAAVSNLVKSPSVKGTPFEESSADWIRRNWESFKDKSPKALLAAPDSDRRPWILLESPGAAVRGLLGVVLSVCEVEPARIGQRIVLCIDASEVVRSLPVLVERAGPLGIDVEFENAPVVRADVKVRIEAEEEEEKIDWFELRPEIAIGGKYLSEKEWRDFLEQRVREEPDGSWSVLDNEGAERLRRVAVLLDQHRHDFELSMEPEANMHPMAWRLRLLDWLAFRRAGIELILPDEDRQVLESLAGFEKLGNLPQPKKLNAQLRDYQRAGYSWLCFLYRHRLGAILADDMGLGKTLQTIAFLAAIREGIASPSVAPEPHLLVLPPILLFNWKKEIATFYPEFRVAEYGNSPENYDILLVSYETARRNIDTLEKTKFGVIVFDEAQNVKNLASSRSKAMRRLQANFKICLTGTPVENHSGEYFAIVDLALPGLLGEYQTGTVEASEHLFARARPFVLRRTKEKILKDLPAKIESEIGLELSAEQKSLYTRMVDEVRAEVLSAYEEKPKGQAGIVALTALTRLRQLCVSPALVQPDRTEPAPKLEYLGEKLSQLISEGHSALVFSQFIGALNLVEAALREKQIMYFRLDGSTPGARRKSYVETFQDSLQPSVLLISLRTGSAGLNLTRAGYVFHLDPWWNPAVEAQATDRAHRIGQKNQVFVQRLVMKHTVEEKIMLLKERKRQLYEKLLSGRENPAAGNLLTKLDFEFLLTLPY